MSAIDTSRRVPLPPARWWRICAESLRVRAQWWAGKSERDRLRYWLRPEASASAETVKYARA